MATGAASSRRHHRTVGRRAAEAALRGLRAGRAFRATPTSAPSWPHRMRREKAIGHPTREGIRMISGRLRLIDPSEATSKNGELPYRRRYVRVAVDAVVSYEREGVEGPKEGHSSDLGGGGIRLSTSEDLPLGSVLLLRFRLPGGDRDVLARGRIVLRSITPKSSGSFMESRSRRSIRAIRTRSCATRRPRFSAWPRGRNRRRLARFDRLLRSRSRRS